MSRLDPVSGQIVARPVSRTAVTRLRIATWALLAACPLVSAWLGVHLEGNPADAAARGVSLVPLLLLAFDGWALGLSLLRRRESTPLYVPARTPAILGAVHFLVWLWTRHLASFDGLYYPEALGEGAGIYVVGWVPAVLLGTLVTVSCVIAVLQARMVSWVLLSEQTAVPAAFSQEEAPDEPDAALGPEHVYEAQMLLNNLGFAVGQIDGDLGEATRQALVQFQTEADLKQTGQVTVLTMIELRNRWATQDAPQPGQTALVLSGHLFRRLLARLRAWRGSPGE